MKNEIKEITEIITRLQDCGRKRISRTEGVIVNNEDIATALYKAGYRVPISIAFAVGGRKIIRLLQNKINNNRR